MTATVSIMRLAESLAEAQLADDPFLASVLGFTGYDGMVADVSPEARQA